MALVFADRVRQTSTTTGTGTLTLTGEVVGFQTFDAIGDGNTTYYTIHAEDQWEVGIGVYYSSGPVLERITVLDSSAAGALVDFAAGEKDVFSTYAAGKTVIQDVSGNVGIGTSPSQKLSVAGTIQSTTGGFKFPDNTVQTTAATAPPEVPFSIPVSFIPAAQANEVLVFYTFTEAVTFISDFPDAFGAAAANATSTVIFSIYKNPVFTAGVVTGGTVIGTVTFTTSGNFVFATTDGDDQSFLGGDSLAVVAPSSADATALGTFTLRGVRV